MSAYVCACQANVSSAVYFESTYKAGKMYLGLQGSGSVLATRNMHLVGERESMHAWDLTDEGGIHEHSQFWHLKLRSAARLRASAAGRASAQAALLTSWCSWRYSERSSRASQTPFTAIKTAEPL